MEVEHNKKINGKKTYINCTSLCSQTALIPIF